MPIENKIKIDRQPVDKGLNHAENLRKNEQPAPIESIRDGTAESAEEQPRDAVEKPDDAQKKSGAGQMPNEPALRHVLHKIAGIRKQGSDEP